MLVERFNSLTRVKKMVLALFYVVAIRPLINKHKGQLNQSTISGPKIKQFSQSRKYNYFWPRNKRF